jgi:hypothetical protein
MMVNHMLMRLDRTQVSGKVGGETMGTWDSAAGFFLVGLVRPAHGSRARGRVENPKEEVRRPTP